MRKLNPRKRELPITSKPIKSEMSVTTRPANRTPSVNRRLALSIERELDLQDPERWDGMG